LSDPRTNVQFVFVAEHLQWLLLDAATRQRTPYELLQRARQAFREPEEHSHDNHFHVRVFCAPNDRPRCRDEGVVWPPYGHRRRPRGELARARTRATRLGLGTNATAVAAMRRPPPRGWLEVIPGASPSYLGWPVTKGYYNRGFGFTREDNPDVPHNGIDIGAPEGSVVRASADGLVVFAGEFRSYGNVVFLVHKNGWVTNYAHCQRTTVRPGELVRRGQPIALLGNTGVSRGPHVHYEYRVHGHVRDPEPVMRGIRRWTDEHGPPRRIESSAPRDGEVEGETEPVRRVPVRVPTRTDEGEESSGDEPSEREVGEALNRFGERRRRR
jgi:murein DD-endopeptidase MepM/ murein hydrolase activator NlpD